MDWGRRWLVDFSAEITQLVSFDQSNNAGAVFVKMNVKKFCEKIFLDTGVVFLF